MQCQTDAPALRHEESSGQSWDDPRDERRDQAGSNLRMSAVGGRRQGVVCGPGDQILQSWP